MANMALQKTPMPERPARERINSFDEVALGYTPEAAVEEAARCLQCKHKPCVKGCPVQVAIPEFIALIQQQRFEEAYLKIAQTNSLPAVCGRVCPQENQCEKYCVRGIKGESVGIGRLERFAADYHLQHGAPGQKPAALRPEKVAVVGAGPAGLTCAGDLARMGYRVTLFEAFHEPGGVLMYGIPEFRLPKRVVRQEIEAIEALGVTLQTNAVIGKTITVDELFEEGYRAVFLGTGAGLPHFQGIPGENLKGVYSANEFLTRINLMKAYDQAYDTPIFFPHKVTVIGGGNVAMDAARSAKRLGAESVKIVYRRSEAEMPARQEEIEHAKHEGIEFAFLTIPVQILPGEDGFAGRLECVRMELGEPDASGRRRPIPIEGSNFMMEADTVIVAIGSTPNPLIRNTTEGLEVNRRGCLVVNEETLQTTREGVYAGGDTVTGAATVILAMGAGKQAAHAINDYFLNGNKG